MSLEDVGPGKIIHVVAGKPIVIMDEPGIQWKPIAAPVRLRFSGTSREAVSAALKEAFGDFPIRLHKGEQMMILKGMMATAGEGKQPYQELMTALAQVGELEISEA